MCFARVEPFFAASYHINGNTCSSTMRNIWRDSNNLKRDHRIFVIRDAVFVFALREDDAFGGRFKRLRFALFKRLQFVETLYESAGEVICPITDSGFETPPDQKSFQIRIDLAGISPSQHRLDHPPNVN